MGYGMAGTRRVEDACIAIAVKTQARCQQKAWYALVQGADGWQITTAAPTYCWVHAEREMERREQEGA